MIRSVEACLNLRSACSGAGGKSTILDLHLLAISTAKETTLFRNDIHLNEKRITAKACVHHLWFFGWKIMKKYLVRI